MNPFQLNSDSDDIKRKQEEFTVDIRRQNREEMFQKKRNFPQVETINQTNPYTYKLISSIPDEKLRDQIEVWLKQKYTLENLPQISNSIKSPSLPFKILGTLGVRKILSVGISNNPEENPPIQSIIDEGIIPYLIEYMNQEECLYLIMESAWALTNIASGTPLQTKCLIDKGVIPLFVKLLYSEHTEIVEQAIWAIGNIAGDSREYRNQIIEFGAVRPLVNILANTQSNSTFKHGVWALSNLCRGRPAPPIEKLTETIPIFAKAIIKEADPEILTDSAWALSFITESDDIDNGRIETLFKSGAIPYFVKCLNIGTVGNISTGDDKQTDYIISVGLIDYMKKFFNHEKKTVRREICWALSNITAGSAHQIRSVINDPQTIAILKEIIMKDVPEVSREASWLISNATSRTDNELLISMINWGIFSVLIEMLSLEDSKQVSIALDAILNILNKGEHQDIKQNNQNPFLDVFEKLDGTVVIENLQNHPAEEVYQKALLILESFYDIEDPI